MISPPRLLVFVWRGPLPEVTVQIRWEDPEALNA